MNQINVDLNEIASEQVIAGKLSQRDALILNLIEQIKQLQQEIEELKKEDETLEDS